MIILKSMLKAILEDILVEALPEKSMGEIVDISDMIIDRLSDELDIYDEDEEEEYYLDEEE